MSLESAPRSSENAPHVYPIADNHVQMRLMELTKDLANPEDPFWPWFKEEEGDSLAARFREYVEMPEHKNETVDIDKPEEVTELLDHIKPTIH